MLKQSKNFNPNYAAQIVTLKNQTKHPNADRLLGWIIQGCRIWTSLDYQEGDVVVFFPLESCINSELLSYLNLYRDKQLNSNKELCSFFEANSRVKALKLRGSPSEGFVLKIELLEEFIKYKLNTSLTYEVGEVFDSVEDIQICKKYVIRQNPASIAKSDKKNKRALHLVDNQFRLHYDTEKLAQHEYLLNQGDICVISDKWHGTSLVSAKLLVHRKLSILEKVFKFLKFKIQETTYDYIYSSRKVIKAVGESANSHVHYYNEDIWKLAHNQIKDFLQDGISIYAEIVGHLPTGGMIQKDYDYGCNHGQFKVLIYRITSTNHSGNVFEWDWASIKNFCLKYGLYHIPELYYGPVNFTLEQLKEKYLEKDCFYCINKVPAEGFCFRNESKDKIAYKCKSFRFLKKESDILDTGEIDIETLQEEQKEI